MLYFLYVKPVATKISTSLWYISVATGALAAGLQVNRHGPVNSSPGLVFQDQPLT
jgi:hypothetical protein